MEAQAINEPLSPGTPAPTIALDDPSSEVVRLEDFRALTGELAHRCVARHIA